jgi:hypothetical protein
MLISLALILVAVGCATAIAVSEIRRSRQDATAAALLALFATAAAEARNDPQRLLAWQPAIAAARRLFGGVMTRLDSAAGGPFPFGESAAKDAHARWTASWLTWERTHDEEYKLKAAAAEAALARGEPDARGRLAAIEREKLERYQQRYEEYVRTSKALAALCNDRPASGETGSPR